MADYSSMRSEVHDFTAEGPLPGEDADEREIGRRAEQLAAISRPVTPAEARALTTCFGHDNCYGVAWTLLHLIETCPDLELTAEPAADANQWHQLLWRRTVSGGLL
jgi:hypothetical protein